MTDRSVRAVLIDAVRAGDVAAGDALESLDGAVDVGRVVVATEADPHQARGSALVAVAGATRPRAGGSGVEAEQVEEVRVGAEAAAAYTHSVLVAEDRGDERVIETVHEERDHADPRADREWPTRSVESYPRDGGKARRRVP
jgi:hypothetical protein